MEAFFYMTFVDGKAAPTVKHETHELAETEAERLTRKEGKTTYVLAAIAKCVPPPEPPVQWILPEQGPLPGESIDDTHWGSKRCPTQ